MSTDRKIEDVVETLRKAHNRKSGCVLLIGAGCSKTAGIPLASEFIKIIQEEYPRAYKYANPPTYANCMENLSPSERKSLISRHIDKAKINWAHLAIAQLIKEGYVDRVLTTNFDPLIVRACAMVGEFPAVYDSASSQLTENADVHEKSVFYLHGQRTGFLIMNTQTEVEQQKPKLAPVFKEAGVDRLWLVVGYSGETDPVFEHLAQIQCFKNHLYWVGYRDKEPPHHVQNRLLDSSGKYAFYVRGHDADSFFIKLAQELNCFPPKMFEKPCSYLTDLKNSVCEFPLPSNDNEGTVAITSELDRIIALGGPPLAKGRKKTPTRQSLLNKAQAFFPAGKYDEIITLYNKATPQTASAISYFAAWSHVALGNSLYEQAGLEGNIPQASKLFGFARQNYSKALSIKPDMHEAANNWGTALDKEAKAVAGNDLAAARALWRQAGEEFEQALKIKPDKHEAAYNWGTALDNEAQTVAGSGLAAARALWRQAGEKYEQALKIKPDMHEAAYNWGTALVNEAKAVAGSNLAATQALWRQAGEKFEQALKIKPDMHEAAYNWGTALVNEAKAVAGSGLAAARALWRQAGEKYEQALKIKPDMHEAANNWGIALDNEAQAVAGSDLAAARALWRQAGEKYEQALKIKPDDHEAATNWGVAFISQGNALAGSDPVQAHALWKQAVAKCQSALAIKPDYESAYFNSACAYARLSEVQPCCESLAKWKQYARNVKKQKLDSEKDFDGVRQTPEFQAFRELLPD